MSFIFLVLGDPERLLIGRLELEAEGEAADSGLSRTRRVRGRLSLRSGSAGTDGPSDGEAVTDLDFLLRRLGLAVSISLAFSNADHALDSSIDSTGVSGRIVDGTAARKASRAPCRVAILIRRCH